MRTYTSAAGAPTPQTQPIPGREAEMTKNDAGGVSFKLDLWKRVERFLILGTEGGTYYVGVEDHTKRGIKTLDEAVKANGLRLVIAIAEISEAGRAVSNDPAIFALAYAIKHGDVPTKLAARAAVNRVVRTGTHLFHFAAALKALGASGPAARKALACWYDRPALQLAHQLAKYRQRDGWTHTDVLALAHHRPKSGAQAVLLAWGRDRLGMVRDVVPAPSALQKKGRTTVATYTQSAEALTLRESRLPLLAPGVERFVRIVDAVRGMQEQSKANERALIRAICDQNLPREVIPTWALNSTAVWEALLFGDGERGMPLGALVRNLGKMAAVGLTGPMSQASIAIANRLADVEALRRARLHPLSILVALRTYASGQGLRGSLSWTPDSTVQGALSDAFAKSFTTVRASGMRHYFGLDVSGSMGSPLGGLPINCREASSALALVSLYVEPYTYVAGFTGGSDRRTALTDLSPFINRTVSPLDALNATARLPFGTTDCALPMVDALARKIPVDVFVIVTDNETYAGHVQPVEALARYRKEMGIPAKLIVVGMTANDVSIADPTDAGMLDVVGFDTTTPAAIADFASDGRTSMVPDDG